MSVKQLCTATLQVDTLKTVPRNSFWAGPLSITSRKKRELNACLMFGKVRSKFVQPTFEQSSYNQHLYSNKVRTSNIRTKFLQPTPLFIFYINLSAAPQNAPASESSLFLSLSLAFSFSLTRSRFRSRTLARECICATTAARLYGSPPSALPLVIYGLRFRVDSNMEGWFRV